MHSQVILLEDDTPTSITVINTTSIDGESIRPEILLTLPLELLEKFINDNESTVRIISAVYRNVSTIFLNNPNKQVSMQLKMYSNVLFVLIVVLL